MDTSPVFLFYDINQIGCRSWMATSYKPYPRNEVDYTYDELENLLRNTIKYGSIIYYSL